MNQKKLIPVTKSSNWEDKWFMFKVEVGEKTGDFFRAFWRMLPNKIKYQINRLDMWLEKGAIEHGHRQIDTAERIAAQQGRWTFRTRQMRYKGKMLVIRSTEELNIMKKKATKYSES